MANKTFPSGRIREIAFDPRDRHLEIIWEDKSITAYRPVPAEVAERLCKAPSPVTYFEDRIAEEYPQTQPRKKQDSVKAAQRLNDLFAKK